MALKEEHGKQAVIIVELYLDQCVLDYGVAPCTAAVGVSGTQKCFRTLKTCQDLENYDRGTDADRKVLRFATTEVLGLQSAGQSPTFPTVTAIDMAPTKLEPGRGIGIRSSVSIELVDHPWTDVGIDPYLSDRAYVADDRGTFWGKLLARWPNYENRRIDILTGFLTEDGEYDAANFRRRTYLLSKISGPSPEGRVRIEAKDPLKAADTDRATWPVATKAQLSGALDNSATSFGVADPDGYVASNFAAGQLYLRIDDEIMEMTSVVDDGGGFYTVGVNRSTAPAIYDDSYNTQAAHDVGAAVQPCWYFLDKRIDEVVATLLGDGAQIDSAFLPTADWSDAILQGGMDNYVLSALISEPVGVKELLIELSQHGLLMWWDEREQVVKLQSTIASDFDDTPLNEDEHIIAGSISVSRDVRNRVSQVWMLFGHRFPTLDIKKLTSFRNIEIKADTGAESPEEYGQAKITQIASRWLTTAKRATASEIGSRLLRSYRDSKILMTIALDPKDDDAWTGDVVGIITASIQDETGSPAQTNFLVLEVSEDFNDAGVVYKYVLQAESTLQRTGLITPNNADNYVNQNGESVLQDGDNLIHGTTGGFPDYSSASTFQKNRYAFIAPNSGFFSDGKPAYQIQ